VLVIAWLMATFRARGPYPILNIHGGKEAQKPPPVYYAVSLTRTPFPCVPCLTELRHIAPNLRETQVLVTFLPKGAKGKRLLRVERVEETSPVSPPTNTVPRVDVSWAGGDALGDTATSLPQSLPCRHPSPSVPPPVFGARGHEKGGVGGEGGDTVPLFWTCTRLRDAYELVRAGT